MKHLTYSLKLKKIINEKIRAFYNNVNELKLNMWSLLHYMKL